MVLLVMRLVKSLTFPTARCEKVCTPPTTEAAKSAPGRAPLDPRPRDGIEGVAEAAPADRQDGS